MGTKETKEVEGQMSLWPLLYSPSAQVFMSNELVVGRQDLSLNASKTLRVLFSKVLQNDMEFREYSFGVSELARAINTDVSRISHDSEKIVSELAFKGLRIKEPTGRIVAIPWAPYAEYDPVSRKFTIQLNERLAPFLLGLENYFTSYNIDTACGFGTVYGLRLFELLKKENYGAEFSVRHKTDIYLSVEDIRFACGLDEYDANGKVIKRKLPQAVDLRHKLIDSAIRDIQSVFPTMGITYAPKKAGRSIAGFFFTITPMGGL